MKTEKEIAEEVEKEIAEIKSKHKGNFLTLWSIYTKNKRFIKSKQLWGAVVITLICSIFLFFFTKDVSALSILDKLINRILSIMPNILGFTLAGYVLLIGFGSDEFLEGITEQDDCDYSFFQHFSSIFAWSIIIQANTLLVSFILSFISDYNIISKHANIINFIVLMILLILSFYSILLIIRLVLNVFHFSQLVQFYFTEKRLVKRIAEEEKINEEMNSKN